MGTTGEAHRERVARMLDAEAPSPPPRGAEPAGGLPPRLGGRIRAPLGGLAPAPVPNFP